MMPIRVRLHGICGFLVKEGPSSTVSHPTIITLFRRLLDVTQWLADCVIRDMPHAVTRLASQADVDTALQ